MAAPIRIVNVWQRKRAGAEPEGSLSAFDAYALSPGLAASPGGGFDEQGEAEAAAYRTNFRREGVEAPSKRGRADPK